MPSVVVNVTTVPFCTAVPELSVTVATMSTEPLVGTDDPVANRAMVDSVGAVSGTLSHAEKPAARHAKMPARRARRAAGWRNVRANIGKRIVDR